MDWGVTREEPFFREDDRPVRVPLMRQQCYVQHFEGNGFRAVDIPFKGGQFSLLVLLPEQRAGLPELERALEVPMFADAASRLRTWVVDISLPRFKAVWRADLNTALRAMGIEKAFNPSMADFSGIDGRSAPDPGALFLSAVLHKAVVDVDEEGTTAAAATVGALTLGTGPRPGPLTFRADHPFMYVIRHVPSGTILFLGRCANPLG